MEVILIANHIIRPSSPTPHILKTHKLSSIDQILPSIYTPLIFLYKGDESNQHDEILQRLKQSLSEILTIFYPLAGTIKENMLVDCDDTGVEMVEARVSARLEQLIENPKMEDLEKLIPRDIWSHQDSQILSVKASLFECGGMTVGVCLSHKVVDGTSFVMFMNAWAATCRGEEDSRITRPNFDLSFHFPPKDPPPTSRVLMKQDITTKRLVFGIEKIEKLRKEASSSSRNSSSSRVEAVSAFIWGSFMEAANGKSQSVCASHAVNLRPRTVPPLPDYAFGNCITATFALFSSEEDYDGGNAAVLVSKLRDSIRAVDHHYINNVIKHLAPPLQHHADYVPCWFTSWFKFPVYDVDFGWGKPVWVCSPTRPIPNLVLLMSTPSRDGIEAWINIPDDHFFDILITNFNNLLN